VLVLVAFAYRPLLLGALAWPGLGRVEGWFFAPDEKAPLFAVGVVGWMLWRHRGRLAALPEVRAPAGAALLFAIGAALFVWAQLTLTADLLLPSLSANLLAFACAARGGAGVRVVGLPAAVLLLGVPIPGPVRSEIVWQLQLWSAQSAAWVLATIGREVALSGVQILHGPFGFTVIDACSGLRGIEILLLVAFVIRELFASSGRRQWLLVALAPALGFALNLARIVFVVLSTAGADPAQAGPGAWDHTFEGVAVLAAGTALLYALGWWMAGSQPSPRPATPERAVVEAGAWPPLAAVAALAALAAVSVAVPPFPPTRGAVEWVELPRSHAGWEGEDLALDRVFFGPLYGAQAVHRRYQKAQPGGDPQAVEIFVGAEMPESPGDRIFSRRVTRLGPDWSLRDRRRAELWTLRVEGELAVVSRRSELALVYVWRLRDRGILWHAQRALLGLDRAPLSHGRPRAVVRLATPLARDGALALDRSKRILDRFIADFARELAAL
jgi:exosortase